MKTKILIELLTQAKIEIISFDHAFEYAGKVYYKLLPSDKANLMLTVAANTFKKVNPNTGEEEDGEIIEPLRDYLVLNIETDFGGYSLPANTYFIDETIRALQGKSIAKFAKYEEHAIDSDFEGVGTISPVEAKHLKELARFTCKDTLRPQFDCVCLRDGYVYASDAHRLVKEPSNNPINIQLPSEALRFMANQKQPADIYQSEEKIKVSCGDKVMLFDRVREQFPYEGTDNILAGHQKYTATINRQELIKAIKQVAKYANQASNMVKLSFKGKYLEAAGQDQDCNVASAIKLHGFNADFTGDVGFKSLYLLDVLSYLKDEMVTLKLNAKDDKVMLGHIVIMPMVIDGEEIRGQEAEQPSIKPKMLITTVKRSRFLDINRLSLNQIKCLNDRKADYYSEILSPKIYSGQPLTRNERFFISNFYTIET